MNLKAESWLSRRVWPWALPLDIAWGESHFLRFVQHEFVCRFMVVGYDAVPYGILDSLLQDTYLFAGAEPEGFHYLFACDGILPCTIVVTGLQVSQLLSDQLEVVQETLLLLLVAACDVSLTQYQDRKSVV